MRKLPAFQLDLRSLGVFRIGLGVVTMLDLFERWPWLATFYSPSGVFPTARGIVSRFPSIFALSESDATVHVVWSVALFAAILFTAGVRTRVSALLAFYFVACLNLRNDVPLNCGHDVERIFLFWAMFLPCDARFALGRRDEVDARSIDPRIHSAGTIAFVIQLALLYAFSGFEKLTSPAWREGREVLQALVVDPGESPVARLLGASPSLCRIATFGALALELAMPVLLMIGRARGWLVAIAIAFHVALGAALSLDLFPATCAVVWLALIPTSFWEQPLFARYRDSIGRRLPAIPRFVTIAMNRIHASSSRIHSLPKWNEWLIAIALLSAVAANADGMHWLPWPRATLPARVLGISQFWGMYSDDTRGVASWVAPRATLGDGSQVDAWSGGTVDPSFDAWAQRPWQVRSEFDAIGAASSVDLRRSFVRWACRRNGVVNVQIVRLEQRMVTPREAEPRVTTIDSLPCQ